MYQAVHQGFSTFLWGSSIGFVTLTYVKKFIGNQKKNQKVNLTPKTNEINIFLI
jgi:hypothetical protein